MSTGSPPADLQATDTNVAADGTPLWGAAETVRRGWRASPELRRGALVTVLLAFAGTAGRLAIPVLIQQGIDKGFVNGEVDMGRIVRLCAIGAVVITAGVDRHVGGHHPACRPGRRGALRPARPRVRPHPRPRPRRPRGGAPRLARRPRHVGHRDAEPVLLVGRHRLAARRHDDHRHRGRDDDLRLAPGPHRPLRGRAARASAPGGPTPPRAGLQRRAGAQRRAADIRLGAGHRRGRHPRLPPRTPHDGRDADEHRPPPALLDPGRHHRRVPVPLRRAVLGPDDRRRPDRRHRHGSGRRPHDRRDGGLHLPLLPVPGAGRGVHGDPRPDPDRRGRVAPGARHPGAPHHDHRSRRRAARCPGTRRRSSSTT